MLITMLPLMLTLLALSEPSLGVEPRPVVPPALPHLSHGDLERDGARGVTHYDCAPSLVLAGPERTLWLELQRPGMLRAEGSLGGPRPPWLLLMREPSVDGDRATGCIARGEGSLTLPNLEAGRYLLVLESPGPAPDGMSRYSLAVETLPAGAWSSARLAEGLWWERRWDPAGPSTVSVLRIAPAAREMLRPVLHDGCNSVPTVARSLGAIAAVNAGFFSTRCAPLCAMVSDGEVLATNAMDKGPQRSLGWTAEGTLRWTWLEEGQAHRGVDHAIGGFPSLIEGGSPAIHDDLYDGFAQRRHPRTALGTTAEGTILLVVVDGRSSMGAGLDLAELTALLQELGAVDAVNLDGGGSSTMWVEGLWSNGVVNHPCDNLQPDHEGARPVSDGLYLIPPEPPPIQAP